MKEIFDEILATFENNDLKEFMENKCIPTIPPWFWGASASSTGKYHPGYTLGPLGLAKHTVAVARFLNHMFGVESITTQFTSRERDMLRIAALMHDTRKSGTQEDYEKSHYTKFDHPLQAAAVIRSLDGVPKEEIEFIAHAIESHMGAFNTDKRHPKVVLPKPTDKYQIILHLADYLASRKDIEIKFDNTIADPKVFGELPQDPKPGEQPTLDNWRFTFGKHIGQTIPEVNALDPSYIEWAKKNMEREPARTLLQQI